MPEPTCPAISVFDLGTVSIFSLTHKGFQGRVLAALAAERAEVANVTPMMQRARVLTATARVTIVHNNRKELAPGAVY